ncbi:MAG TPA: zinc-binding dehydrogenase [Pseudonocardiaceae bacterium]
MHGEHIGGRNGFGRLRRALTPRGTLVVTGGEGGDTALGIGRVVHALALSPFVRQRLTAFVAAQRHTDMTTLGELIEVGRIMPVVGASYPLAEVPEAMRQLESGQARGKIAITI